MGRTNASDGMDRSRGQVRRPRERIYQRGRFNRLRLNHMKGIQFRNLPDGTLVCVDCGYDEVTFEENKNKLNVFSLGHIRCKKCLWEENNPEFVSKEYYSFNEPY
jgi:hypothetical protein